MIHLHPRARRPGWTDLAGLVGLVLLSLSSCERSGASDRPQVVLYYSADDVYARPILELFEVRTGIEVIARTDTEATKTTGLVQRLRAEKSRPRADVFWSSEVFLTIQLAEEGLLAPHTPSVDHGRPAHLSDANDLWHGFAQRARVLVYNTKLVSAQNEWATELLPGSLNEIVSQWSSSMAMANPNFGTTRGHMAALVAAWGEDGARKFLRSLRFPGVQILDGNSSVVRAVGEGRVICGLTDTDDVWAGKRNGLPIEMIYLRHDDPVTGTSHGPLLIPNTVARVKGGPNPENAAALIEFLLEPIVERMLAESDSHNIPTHPSLVEEFEALMPLQPMTIPYEDIAEKMDIAMRLCQEELTP